MGDLLGIQRFDTFPDTRDAKCQLLIPLSNIHETRLFYHPCKLLLRGEVLDRLDEVLIAVPVPRNELSHQRDDGERVLLIDGVEGRRGDLGELEAGEDTAGFENSVGGLESHGDTGHVADAEGNGVEVDGVVGNAV